MEGGGLQWSTTIYIYIYGSRKSIIFEMAKIYIYGSSPKNFRLRRLKIMFLMFFKAKIMFLEFLRILCFRIHSKTLFLLVFECF